MFYEDLFDLEDDVENHRKKYNSPFRNLYDLKSEKRFYCIYSALTECHGIFIGNQMYEHKLYDIKSMKSSERILELSYKDIIHFFDVNSFMEASIKNNSLLLKNTKEEDVEIIPVQIRSMINDGELR